MAAGVGALEIVGIVLFVLGSTTNTWSELLRDRWKRHEENRGKLYTGGLFRFAVHSNYFGDVLWVVGLALIARHPWGLFVPVLLFCFFAFYNGPLLDKHLEQKYGDSFTAYAKRTAKIVPFIHRGTPSTQ